MNLNNTLIFCVICCLPLCLFAQGGGDEIPQKDETNSGILWTNDLNWKQVLNRAKRENKYIFVDCFATWCGPCKAMEKGAFREREVGEYFNSNFISVRLQMDRTVQDDAKIRSWYNFADAISKEYGIPAFPTLLFFSPNGQLVYRDVGLKFSHELLDLAKKAKNPKVAVPYRIYYSLLAKYQQGKRDYSTMAGLADTAKRLHQNEIAASVSKEYRTYLLSMDTLLWFTPQNISFMANFMDGPDDPFFSIFYNSKWEVDSLIKKNGFAEFTIDKIISESEIEPFTKPIKGARFSNQEILEEPEPDWQALLQNVTIKYDSSYASRNVLKARVQWHMDHHDWISSAKYFTQFIKKYKITYSDDQTEVFLNAASWNAVFQRSVNKEHIDAAIECISEVLKRISNKGGQSLTVMDTYANLLYKAGRTGEAIKIEEEALQLSAGDSRFKNVVDRMKSGKPTWPHYITDDFFDGGLID